LLLKIKALLLVVAGTALASCGGHDESHEKGVVVEGAFVRLSAVPGQPGAAYFTIMSHGGAYRLDGISSPQVERIELHDNMSSGGMSKMSPLPPPEIGDGAMLEFKPGGRHGMLFGIAPTVRAGGRMRLTFSFTPAVRVDADVPVIGAGDPAPTDGEGEAAHEHEPAAH